MEDDITEVRRMGLRDQKIAKLSDALKAMIDRWEPDCDGQDRCHSKWHRNALVSVSANPAFLRDNFILN